MKIAHVITRLIIGGAQENTLLNCQDLIDQFNDEVLLIVGPTDGPEGSLMDQAKVKVPMVILPDMIRSIRPHRDFRAYRALKRVLRDFGPDIVHTHSAKAGILGRAAAWSLKVPGIVHTVHGAPFYPYQNFLVRELYKSCERWAAKRCHAMISVADAMTQLMVENKIAPETMFSTIYSGMQVEPLLNAEHLRDKIRAEYGFTASNIVVGKIARLFHLKGHEFVIEAAQSVIRKNPQVRFFFVGDGILAERFHHEIAKRKLTDYFVFSGLVKPTRIPELIAAMDIVVHTSLREGLARVLPQALLSGKPAISYDIDGAREVVINNETGILLPPREIEGLADAILELAEDPTKRERFGQNGKQRFAEQFDHRFMTKRIRTLYETLLEKQDTTSFRTIK